MNWAKSRAVNLLADRNKCSRPAADCFITFLQNGHSSLYWLHVAKHREHDAPDFRAALEDDLNTSAALASIHAFMSRVNRATPGRAAAERLAQDQRFPALLLTASATRSAVSRLRRALDAIGRDPRVQLVMTDADAEA